MAKSKARPKKRKKNKAAARPRRVKARKKRGPVARKRRKRSVGAKRKTPVKRRKRSQGRKLVKQTERRSVERVMAGKRPRKRRYTRRRVRMAGPLPRRRTVGKSGSSGLLIGLAIGAGALYLLTRGSTTTPNYSSLPPLSQTGNYTRDTQSQQILNYAMAAGLTISAITSLINSLNSSSDSTVDNVYDKVNTTGDLYNLGLPGYDPIA